VLSLLAQLNYLPGPLFSIPASCFFPQPEVDSACVTLIRRPERLLSFQQQRTFISIVKRAFSQRRKMMLKLLKQDWPAQRLKDALDQLALRADIRAEAIPLLQFVALAKLLCEGDNP
jgi:16S rRNA (adenine1518-N6/adenine1519-N6)-dimethyltransferase